jgi:catechol 2,3-dioxygenase
MIHAERIAHVVLKVRDLARSRRFYTEVLGMDVMGEVPGVVFLSNGRRDHHELGLAEIGAGAPDAPPHAVGLVHVAFRLRNEEELRAAYAELQANGVEISYTVNHGVTKSVYFFDPDRNELELYVDNPPAEVASFENPYGGTEKLEFAPNQPGLADAFKRVMNVEFGGGKGR